MAVNVSAWSIRHPIPPIVIALAIAAIGYLSFIKLPITRYPNVDVPLVTVLITQFGASPGDSKLRLQRRWRMLLLASPGSTMSCPRSGMVCRALRLPSVWEPTPTVH